MTHLKMPKTSKTLLKTPRTANMIAMDGGTYCHIGVAKCLSVVCLALSKNRRPIPEEFTVDFNIDGVNYTKSTKSSLTLIQMSLRDFDFNPFVIGAYCGKDKPECNEFLKCFVDEMNKIISDGFHYGDDIISIKPGNFCCDTPAASFIRGSKGHAGYSSCMKCTQKGIRLDCRLVFPYITQADRTNEDFRNRKDPEHHVKTSILESIESVDMVRSFPVDEMHVIHLGIVKKLVTDWISELNKNELEAIFKRIEIAERYRPVEIRRQIRHLTEFKQFKAKEFRTILMYTGPFLLKDILESRKYNHFLLLHVAMRKLCDKRHHNDIESIQRMIENFVRQYKQLYGLNRLTFVVHNLIHLCNDVELYGPPKNFSTYKYENNNNKIVQNIRHGKNVAQQIYTRAIEAMNVLSLTPMKSSLPELKDMYIDDVDKTSKYRKLIFKDLVFDGSRKNQWILTKNRTVCCFEHAGISNDRIFLSCNKMCTVHNFFTYPINSIDINIFFIKENCEKTRTKIDVDSILTKMYSLPSINADGIALFPIINE